MPTKLHSLFSSYLSHLERKGDKDETVKRNRHVLARHDAWLSDLWIEPPKVTELVVEEYFAWLDGVVEQTTANREAGMVRGAYRYAVRIGMIDKDPAEYVKAPSVEEAEPDVYTNEELRRIRAALRTDLEEVIFYGFAYTGLRRCELCKLKPEAHADIDRRGNWVNYVDFERQEIKVIGKGGKFRKVPLHPALAEVWAAHLRRNPDSKTILGKGGSQRNVNERLEQLLRRAGVDGGNRSGPQVRGHSPNGSLRRRRPHGRDRQDARLGSFERSAAVLQPCSGRSHVRGDSQAVRERPHRTCSSRCSRIHGGIRGGCGVSQTEGDMRWHPGELYRAWERIHQALYQAMKELPRESLQFLAFHAADAIIQRTAAGVLDWLNNRETLPDWGWFAPVGMEGLRCQP